MSLTLFVNKLFRLRANLGDLISDARLHIGEMFDATWLAQGFFAMVTRCDQVLLTTTGTFGDQGRFFILLLGKSVEQLRDCAVDIKRAHTIEWYSKELSTLWTATPATIVVGQML